MSADGLAAVRPAPQALGTCFTQILNLPDLTTLRRLLASEPVISNRRL